jgi:DNA-binding protein H-NS
MDHNKLKHERSDPPNLPPAAKRRIGDVTEEVPALQKQITELANKLEKQAEEISQLQSAIANLTDALPCDKSNLTPATLNTPTRAKRQSRMNPDPASAPPLRNKSEHIPQQWKLRTPSHPIHCNNAES